MKTVIDDLQFCVDCFFVSQTGDESNLDYLYGDNADEIAKNIWNGIERLQTQYNGQLHSGDDHDEFSSASCDCCGSDLAGTRYKMIILGKD